MNISVFGMGYVGCVLAGGHASQGHNIIGVDVSKGKIKLLQSGRSPVVEKGIDKYIKDAVEKKLLEATDSAEYAVKNSDISLISVGTPSKKNGEIDLSFTMNVCENISKALKEKNKYHLLAFKSTLFPGTVEKKLIPLIEKVSGKKVGKQIGVCHNPEFLREGCGMDDFFNPPTIVIGQLDSKSGDMLEKIYEGIEGERVRTSIKIGEMIKYVNNTFHALKVSFGNEIGKIAKELEIDSHELMKIFCMDKQLNLSPYYLKPGAPYGGSCLTKDQYALKYEASRMGVDVPVINAITPSNDAHIKYCVDMIKDTGKNKIGVLGLSFKEDTDDLRASAILEIVNQLVKDGFSLKIYDNAVASSEKFGTNKEIFEKEFPFLKGLLAKDIKELSECEVIVLKNPNEEYMDFVKKLTVEQILVDMIKIKNISELNAEYRGLCW